jgi:hypothetical protein
MLVMRRALAWAILVVALVAACGGEAKDDAIDDGAALGRALEAAGFAVEEPPGDPSGSPFVMAHKPFEHTVTRLAAGGHGLTVFEFPDPETAEAAANVVSPDGWGVAGGQYEWIASPHFWRSGRIIVLYLGDDGAFLESIKQILGGQFAGS